jgi:phospholipase C
VAVYRGRVDALRFNRRTLLGAVAAGALALGVDSAGTGTAGAAGIRATGRQGLLGPGSLPNPAAPAGTDQVPEIEQIIVVMMENHSFDNLLGMLGRGDCWPLGPDGRPTVALPDGKGNLVRAFHMPSECQTDGVGQNWNLAHHSLVDGNRGFVEGSTGEAVGYFHGADLPFTWDMARTFPIADRWFASLLGQTDPNRRFLFAGTSLGQVGDDLNLDLPPNGTIFDQFNRYGITWTDYYSSLPSIGVWLPLLEQPAMTSHLSPIGAFATDAAAGRLPQFSLVEPDYDHSSEENPQDIQFGDQFLAGVVNAVMSGPQWSSSMVIWTYDEWGGWYDHVTPPAAVPPDRVLPVLSPNQVPARFDQYGFRVPAGVVSPFARREFVSHVVYDHTSVLKTLERKWNLPALTRRDANANDLFAMVDLEGRPAFLTPPTLHAPADPALSEGCLATGPGTIPPRRDVDLGAVPGTPVISPATLPTGAVGSPYSATLTATEVGRRGRWSVISGDLPTGLVLDQAAGTISGTPVAAGSTGATIGVSRRGDPVGAASFTIVVT